MEMKQINAKWPATLIVGKPVTQEQVIDILVQTDMAICNHGYEWSGNNREFKKQWAEKTKNKLVEGLPLEYLENCSLFSSWLGGCHSWIHENGSIFNFSNIGKWPSTEEVFEELQVIAQAFPFLEMDVTLFDTEFGFSSYDDFLKENQDKALFSFSVKNGKVEYHDNPIHLQYDDIKEFISYHQGNPKIDECFVSDELIEKLINKVNNLE